MRQQPPVPHQVTHFILIVRLLVLETQNMSKYMSLEDQNDALACLTTFFQQVAPQQPPPQLAPYHPPPALPPPCYPPQHINPAEDPLAAFEVRFITNLSRFKQKSAVRQQWRSLTVRKHHEGGVLIHLQGLTGLQDLGPEKGSQLLSNHL